MDPRIQLRLRGKCHRGSESFSGVRLDKLPSEGRFPLENSGCECYRFVGDRLRFWDYW